MGTQTLAVTNAGGGTLTATVGSDCPWLNIDRQVDAASANSGIDTYLLSASTASLASGNYACTITISSATAVNSPRMVPVALAIAKTAYVGPGDGEYATIKEAVTAAANGGVIVVRPGTYTEHGIDFGGKKIVLASEDGAETTIVDGNGQGPIFLFQGQESSETIINGFTIRNGATTGAGGAVRIANTAAPFIHNCVFEANSATGAGGGMAVLSRKAVRIEGCLFKNNTAADGGGLSVGEGSTVRLIDTVFQGNSCPAGSASGGGAIHNAGTLTVAASHLSGNSSNLQGGAIVSVGGALSVVNSVIAGNSAATGGGVEIQAGSASLVNCSLYQNKATTGFGGVVGLLTGETPTTLTSTILFDNSLLDNSLLDNSPANTNITPLSADTLTIDPKFAAPGAWSGITWIEKQDLASHPYRLLAGSKAIDVGATVTDLFSDLRGSVRPIDGGEGKGAKFDIGAYEYSAFYGGLPGDREAEPFQALAVNGSVLVTDFEYEISWKDKNPFPNGDDRIFQAGRYEVRLALVNDWGQRVDLDRAAVDISQQGYKLPFTFQPGHIGTWRLRLELASDPNQFVLSERAYTIVYRETTEYQLGQEIKPPKGFPALAELGDAGLVKPEVVNEEYVYWSVNANPKKNRLFAIKPGTTVIIWYDDAEHTTPYPVVARIVRPPAPRIHIADSLPVALLPPGSPFDMVSLQYSDNKAAINANQFTAGEEGWSVLLFHDNDNAEAPESMEVVRTLVWNHAPVVKTLVDGSIASCDPAADGTGNALIIGDPGNDGKAVDAGAAYVFSSIPGRWRQVTKLVAVDGAVGDGFGSAVAIAGDRILVGAASDDIETQTDCGSVYVFNLDGGKWQQSAKLTADDNGKGQIDERFGASLSLSGNWAVVGGPGGNTTHPGGTAYFFEQEDGSWPQLYAESKALTGALQGTSVAISGTASCFRSLIGVPGDSTGGVGFGQALAIDYGRNKIPGLVDPVATATPSTSGQLFQWLPNGTAVSAWGLLLGTNGPGGKDLLNSANLGTATSILVDGLPANGATLYARLRYQVGTIWKIVDTTFTAATTCVAPTAITVPPSGPGGAYAVDWTASTTPGVIYVLEEALDSSFISGLRVAYRGAGLKAAIKGRAMGKTYYYRVKATKAGIVDSEWRIGEGCVIPTL